MIIAIDGPAGSGKSTIAKLISERLGYQYIDTGAMYRAVTLSLLERKYSEYQLNQNVELVSSEDEGVLELYIAELLINLSHKDVFLGARNISSEIRSPLVSANVAQVAAMKIVREHLVTQQRALGAKANCVMDGRDIGTVVFPNAELKIFLTASAEVRARRRLKDFNEQGVNIEFEALVEDIIARDKRDMEREISPLRKAADATEIISDNVNIEGVVAYILDLLEQKSLVT